MWLRRCVVLCADRFFTFSRILMCTVLSMLVIVKIGVDFQRKYLTLGPVKATSLSRCQSPIRWLENVCPPKISILFKMLSVHLV